MVETNALQMFKNVGNIKGNTRVHVGNSTIFVKSSNSR